MTARAARRLIIALVMLHSLALGAVMLASPAWAMGVCGWALDGSAFFPRQSGLFLLILAGGYGAGLWLRPFGWFLVASKAAAVAFLAGEYWAGEAPTAVFLAGLLDGTMGAAVAAALLWESIAARRPAAAGESGQPP